MFGLKKFLAGKALQKMKPLHRGLMIVFLIIATIYAALTYVPGLVASFL